jgi:hypothetical protein
MQRKVNANIKKSLRYLLFQTKKEIETFFLYLDFILLYFYKASSRIDFYYLEFNSAFFIQRVLCRYCYSYRKKSKYTVIVKVI